MEDWMIIAQPTKKIDGRVAVVKRKSIAAEVGAEAEEDEVEVAVMVEEVEVEDEIIEIEEAEVGVDVVAAEGEEVVEVEKVGDTVAVIADLEREDVAGAVAEIVAMLVEKEDGVVDLDLRGEITEGGILYQRVQ